MLSERDLFFIKYWKYKVIDNTITGKLLCPLLDEIINFIPKYISANLITLIGFVIMSSIFIFIEFYGYDKKYIWIILLCYIIASLLDSLDGKQARRIKNETPFGELFDHSVDIFILFIIVRITSYVLGLQNFNLVPTYIVIGSIFCYTHYKAYIDGHLTLNKFTGPNEMLLLIIILYIFSYFVNVCDYVNYNVILYISIIMQFANITFILYQNIVNDNVINRSIIQILTLLYITSIFSIFINISYLSIVSIFIIINAELIVSKMAMSLFKNEIIILFPVCLINGYISLVLSFGYVIIILHKIKKFMNIPFLSTF